MPHLPSSVNEPTSWAMLRKIPFIKPMAPTLAKVTPAGPDWLHEVKFDGWRMQLHVVTSGASLYSEKRHGLYEVLRRAARDDRGYLGRERGHRRRARRLWRYSTISTPG